MIRLRDVTRYLLPRLLVRTMASPGAAHRGPGFVDDEANALRGNAAHAAPGLDSRLWPIPPMVGAEPNPGVITDDWILSQVVFDESAEAPIPAAVLQIEDGPPLEEAVVPPNQVPSSISPTVPFVALQIEDRAAHHAAHPEPAQSWSLTWDQFDQLLGSGSQATPPDFGRLDFDSVPPSRLGIWIFNPFLMLIGDLNLPELTDLSMPCLRMSLLRVFLMMEKMTPAKLANARLSVEI